MDYVEILYLVSFFIGLGFAIITGLLSGVFSGGGEGVGNIDVHGGHIDMGGHAIDHGHSVHIPAFLNPVTMAMFVASFGGSGIIYKKYLMLPPMLHIPLAAGTALAVALLSFYFFFRVMGVSETSSHPTSEEAIGLEAEVLTTIPSDGVGEIAYTLRESRFTNPARSNDGKAIPAHSSVKVSKIVGGTYYVDRIK